MRIKKNAAQFDIFEGLDAEVDIGGDGVVRVAAGHHVVDASERFSKSQIVERNAKECGRQPC